MPWLNFRRKDTQQTKTNNNNNKYIYDVFKALKLNFKSKKEINEYKQIIYYLLRHKYLLNFFLY